MISQLISYACAYEVIIPVEGRRIGNFTNLILLKRRNKRGERSAGIKTPLFPEMVPYSYRYFNIIKPHQVKNTILAKWHSASLLNEINFHSEIKIFSDFSVYKSSCFNSHFIKAGQMISVNLRRNDTC